jgi:DNA-binding NtrC family response regulator
VTADKAPLRHILVVDDNELTCKQLQQLLQAEGSLNVDFRTDGHRAVEALERNNYSIVLTDLQMPKMSGMDLIKEIQKRGIPVAVIVSTGHGSIGEAVQAMRLGAYDFLTKPVDVDHLRLIIDRILRERALQDELATLRKDLNRQYSFQSMLSKNPRMHAIFELISNLGHTTSTVLIEGETGTGKEGVARAVHACAAERTGQFVAVNCAALPETLLESELFGHEKGAFTSAIGQRQGRFELAEGGTIFLDEIGDMPASMQAKLLRVLQERSFERVGGTQTIHVDVRVIAASNRSLQGLVKEKKFREDLFYRLNVVKIDLPPLRDRSGDIPLLATHFIQKYSRPGEPAKQIDPAAMDVLLKYAWPGNIRELENAMERACVTTRDQVIRAENLPADLRLPRKPATSHSVELDQPLAAYIETAIAQIEEEYIRKALERTNGHVGQCAQICGLSRRSITAKMAQYHMDKTSFKGDALTRSRVEEDDEGPVKS